jgi:hypothetical protein
MKISRSLGLSGIFLFAVALGFYLFLGVNEAQAFKDITNPLIAGVVTAFTFCFSFSFLVFNSSIQRFGRESYNFLDKKPLLTLVAFFFQSFLLLVLVKIVPSDQNVANFILIGKLTMFLSFLFLASIVPYFFWLIEHIRR